MKANNSSKQIKIGVVLNYLNIIIGNTIPIFYTPIMLELLGQNEYGLFKLASSTTSYLSLMTLGIGSAVSRYLIKANVEGGKEAEERYFGLFNLVYSLISIVTLVVGLLISANLDSFYSSSLSETELTTMKLLVTIMVINTAIGFSAASYTSVITSHERFVFIQITNVLTTIALPVFNLILLLCGFKSLGLVLVSLVITIIVRVCYIIYVRFILNIKPRYKNLPFFALKGILLFSFWILLSDIVGQIYGATDTVIIGAIPSLGTAAVAIYSIGITFPNIMFSLSQVTPALFSPKVTKMVFSGATSEELTNLVIKVGRLQGYIVALICSGFIAFGKEFINLYVGNTYNAAYWIAIIIMIPNCIPLVQSVAHSIIRAKNMHKFRSIVYLFIAMLNIIGTLALVKKFGIIGAAIPTGVSYLLGQGIVMNFYYWKKVKIDIPKFWKELLPIFFVGICLTVVTLFINKILLLDSWIALIIAVVCYTFAYAIINWLLIMNSDEKSIFLSVLRKVSRYKK